MISFKNQIVLITGASRGIGAAAAVSFARGGASAVAINYLNHLESARLVARDVEAAGAKALSTGDAEPLGHNIIHSVTNPIGRLTGAIHVYGGDFFRAERSEWDPETLLEERYNVEKNLRLFEEANAGLRG